MPEEFLSHRLDAAPRDRPRMDTGADAEKEAAWSRWSLSRRSWFWCSASWWRACCGATPTSCAPCTTSAPASAIPRRDRRPPRPVPVTMVPPAAGPELGAAPAVAGVTPTGDARAVAVDNSDDLTLLGFLSSGCTGCAAFWEALQEPGRLQLPDRTRVVIVTKGPDREIPSEVRAKATGRVPVVMSTDAWLDYQVPGSPFFVLVDGATGRKVGQGVASHVGQLAELVRRAEHDRGPRRRHTRPQRGLARRARPAKRRPTRCWPRPASSRATRASTRAPSTTSSRTAIPCRPSSGHHRCPRHHAPGSRDGFEGRIFVRPAAVGVTYPVGQFATFPIPDDIGDFGSGAVTAHGALRRVRHPVRVRARERRHGAVRPAGPARRALGVGLLAHDAAPRDSRAVGHPVVLHRVRAALRLLCGARQPLPSGAALVPHVNTLLSSLTLSPAVSDLPAARPADGTDRPLPHCRRPALRGRRGQGGAPRRHGAGPGRPGARADRRCALVRPVVRVGALAEAALGAVAHRCSRARPPPRLVALSYLGFFAVVAVRPPARRAARHLRVLRPARHAARPRSIWCSTSRWPRRRRPSPSAPRGRTRSAPQLAHQPWAGFPLLFVSAVGLWLTALALSALAALDRGPSAAPASAGCGHREPFDRAGRRARPSVLEGRLSRRSLINRSAFVGSAVAVGSGLDLALRPGTGLRGHLPVRQRRLWLRQHLLLGVLRVLLRRQRRQLLPGEHDHGGLVGGGQLVVLRRPPLLHGLQRHLLV